MSLKKKKNVYLTLSDYSKKILGKTSPPPPPTPPNSPVFLNIVDHSSIEVIEKSIEKDTLMIKNIEEPYVNLYSIDKNNSKSIQETRKIIVSPKRNSFNICSLM